VVLGWRDDAGVGVATAPPRRLTGRVAPLKPQRGLVRCRGDGSIVEHALRSRGWDASRRAVVAAGGQRGWAMSGEVGDSLVGTTLGAYRVEQLLGSGGMGEVYRGTHEVLGRAVAIKTLKPSIAADNKSVERFFAEARAVNLIRHENIVEVTDLVVEPSGRKYLVMELLDGHTLGQLMRDVGPLAPARSVRIAGQIASAIAAAHDQDIIHRDLKPDNVFLIRRAGMSEYVKVLDFGVARLRPDLSGVDATMSGMLIGTPAYMAPEQARGERALIGVGADIYALGVILFHMLTGRLPFGGTSLTEVLVGHQVHEPPPVRSLVTKVPPALAELVARTLAKRPQERPATMRQLRRELFESVGLVSELPVEEEVVARAPSWRGAAAPSRSSAVGASSLWSGATVDVTPSPQRAPGPAPAPPTEDQRGSSPRPARAVSPALAATWSQEGAVDAALHAQRITSASEGERASALGSGAASGARVAVPAAPSEARAQPGRWRRWRAAVAVAAALGSALGSALLVRQLGAGAQPPASAGRPVEELRATLGVAVLSQREPAAPPPCQRQDRAVLEALAGASSLLHGGAPFVPRDDDRRAEAQLVALRDTAAAQSPEYWHWLARARLFRGAPTAEIAAAAERAISLCPSYAAAHNLLGTALFHARQLPAAERAYRVATKLAPDYVAALANLGLLLIDRRELEEGIAIQSQVIARDPAMSSAYVARGQAYLWRNELERAVADLERAARLEPTRAGTFWLLGNAYQGLQRTEEANAALCQAAKLGHPQAAERCAAEAAR
jgi:serine/threonine protein kinase/Flp pilus assembly protein TadD